uniref:Vacuolar protein sorting-associated protein 53 homolog n=1 Tax=Graphocephala atropunctata TaxID=36148 RepID=A0A1B6MRN2_9HEMI
MELYEEDIYSVNIPSEVMNGTYQIMYDSDSFNDQTFDSINYINSMFPTEQSLTNIDDVITQLESTIKNADDQIRVLVYNQINVGKEGKIALLDTQQIIKQLFLQTFEIRNKAEQCEEKVKEITKDIKQLDCAKHNLTAAITTLNHIHMLFGGLDTLRVLISKQQYGQIMMTLEGILEIVKHFQNYADVPQIRKLISEVHEIQNTLSQQIKEDFHKAFVSVNSENAIFYTQLAGAGLVINALDPKIKIDLLNWFTGIQLSEYMVLFNNSEDNTWLDKIDLRYTWLKKSLLRYEGKFSNIFPSQWEVSERIAIQFCRITKTDLSNMMAKRVGDLDAKLLLYAIQRTRSFEQLLAMRFTGNTLSEGSSSLPVISNTANSTQYKSAPNIANPCNLHNMQVVETNDLKCSERSFSAFRGIIGDCFLPYLYIYIESLDRGLSELMDKIIPESNRNLNRIDQSVSLAEEGILPSCADLFSFYKKSLVQCNQLSNGPPMVSLCAVFKKYLKEFADKILQNNIPKLSSNSFSVSITRDLHISSACSLIPSFIKEEAVGFSKAEIARICCILTSAEYCYETTQQLEEKMREKMEISLVDRINMSHERNIFHCVVSNCIQLLVQYLEMSCSSALNSMSKIQWQTLDSIGDQSEYVTAITSNLKATVPFVKDRLSSSRKYFTQFCIKFSNSFIPKFTQNLYKCKPMSTIGAEQLLLDTLALKTVLLQLPSIGSQVTPRTPTSYNEVVIKGMSRATMILKIVMTPITPGTYFVDRFLKLLPESNIEEFQKILEMKGLKTIEKTDLLSIFSSKKYSEFVT